MKSYVSVLLFVFSTIFFVFNVGIIQLLVAKMHPGGIYYGFFASHSHDYFHYTAIIRNGMEEGGLLFHNQFSDPWKPDVLFMPLYKVFGYVGNVFRINQFVTYFYIRNITALLFVICIVGFILQIYKKKFDRIAAIVLSLTVTSIWFFSQCGTISCVQDPTTYMRPHFSSFYRLLVLPPHHYLAVILLMISMIFVSRLTKRVWWLAGYSLSCILMTVFHPYVGACWLVILGLYVGVWLVLDRQKLKDYIPLFLLTCAVVSPLLYINIESYKLNGGPTVSLQFKDFSVPFPLIEYLKGTGFILIPFTISLLFVRTWKKNKLLIFCLGWFFTPFILYLAPVINQLVSFYRPFQIMPQIPAAIFSVIVFLELQKRFNNVGTIITFIVLVASLGYHSGYMYYQFPYIQTWNNPEHAQYVLFKNLLPITMKLRTIVKPTDVIVAGEKIAPMIPTLINAHVINGHDGNTDNFLERVNSIRILFYGSYTEEQVKQFLNKYQATYIIYGFDSLPFENSPYKHSSFLKELYKEDSWSIVKVMDP